MRENKKEREGVFLKRESEEERKRAVSSTRKAYSQDLRQRIVRAVEQGTSRSDITHLFAVSSSTVKRYLRQKREKGTIQAKHIPGRPPTKRLALQAAFPAQLEAYPDATLQEHCEMWKAHGGINVSLSTMSRAIQQFGWTRKKTIGAKAASRPMW